MMNKEITRDDLIIWIDRSPSNSDLEMCKYIIGLQEENHQLKRQLEYLRSGEYLNQLKFERNMLEDIVQNGGVSKEDKEFIDMTHRNTELLEENKRLKEEYMLLSNASDEYEDKLQARIDKAIEYIENSYYSKNTTNIESIGYTTNKLLRIREILGGKE